MHNQEESPRYSPYFKKKSHLEQSDQEAGGSNDVFNLEKQNLPGKSPKKPRRAIKRFGEMSEEEVLKMKLPEHLDYNLDILFVGINPGLMAAYKGHHYAGANNHFCG